MKVAVVCVLIAHIVVMSSSQPTYDFQQLQSNCSCQQSDEELKVAVNSLKNQVAAMSDKVSAIDNKIELLMEEVQQRPACQDVTIPPGVATIPPSVSIIPPTVSTGPSKSYEA